MRALRAWGSSLAVLAILVASGCSGVTQAQPSAAASASASPPGPSTSANPYEVKDPTSPPVFRPLVVTGVAACEAVTDSQLSELGVSPDSAEDRSNSETADCRWRSNDRRLSAHLVLTNIRGLELVYYWRDTSFNYFEPTEVAGYPAVRDTSPGQLGTCEYLIGVGPSRGVSVNFDGPVTKPVDEYCGLAQRLAAIVIANLQPE